MNKNILWPLGWSFFLGIAGLILFFIAEPVTLPIIFVMWVVALLLIYYVWLDYLVHKDDKEKDHK